jgi:flagella basal body P-ring formation protein FlgA
MIFSLIQIVSILFLANPAFATEFSDQVTLKIQASLKTKTPYATIRIPNLEKLCESAEVRALNDVVDAKVIEERYNGVALIELVSSTGESVRVQTPYQANVIVPVAIQRILPNTRLNKGDFRMELTNVASGPGRTYRGSMIMDLERLMNHETKQTIMEGQFVLNGQVQKSPDLRKGETVQIEILSGDLSLSTAATVLESASIGDPVRVLTAKTKKEITGKVRMDRSVEVKL